MACFPGEEAPYTTLKCGSEDSVVGIQTRYGQGDPGFECWSRQEIFSSPKPPLGPKQAAIL